MGYGRLYFLKKAFPLWPGVLRPVAAPSLMPHYLRRGRTRGIARVALDAAVGAGFLLWIGWRARQVQRRFGLDRAWRRQAIAIARARFADPADLALFRIIDPAALDGYVRRFEDAAINKRLNPLGWTGECALADKRRFAARCAAAGLPHPPLLATVDRGEVAIVAPPAGQSLIAKPALGEGGGGVEAIGRFDDEAALAGALASRFAHAKTPLLVQPWVATHPDLAPIALGALPTVRIVTVLDEGGRAEVVSATFRCAADPAALVDNMKAGGLIVPVDLEDGTLGLACQGYGGTDHRVHPITGAAITGRSLPDWGKATQLARDAHDRAFSDYRLIGWDLALSTDGPVLIEGNGKPGVLMPQRAARRGLLQGRYGALLAHHLATIP